MPDERRGRKPDRFRQSVERKTLGESAVACPIALTDTNWHTYTLELDESNLLRGADNVLQWKNSSSIWYAFDYHELKVEARPVPGLSIVIR